MGVLEGLKIAFDKGLSCVKVQSDNKAIVDTLTGEKDHLSNDKGFVGKIRNMIT